MKKLIDGSCHQASASPAKSAIAQLRVGTETGMHTVVLFTTDLKIFQINLAIIVDASQLEDGIVEKIPTVALKGIIHEAKLPRYTVKRKTIS